MKLGDALFRAVMKSVYWLMDRYLHPEAPYYSDPDTLKSVGSLIKAARDGSIEDVTAHLAHEKTGAGSEAAYLALNAAAKNGKTDIVGFLMDQGVQPPIGSLTPMMMAAIDGRRNVVELLIERGEDVNARTGRGQTALDFAIRYRQHTIVILLLKHGARQ